MLISFSRVFCTFLSALFLVHLAPDLVTGQDADHNDYHEQAIGILEEVPLIDGHNDLPYQYRVRADYKFSEIDLMNTTGFGQPMHTDIPRLREGRVGGQFWSVYVTPNQPESEAIQQTMEQIDFVYRMIERYPDEFELALTADDVERIFEDGKIASMIGMEGGHSIGNSLGVLRQFYNLGARYMSITHSTSIDWADSATDDPVNDGLTEFGKEVVREMNWLGMLVDLSHASSQTMVDAINTSEAPVIFSHSSARAVSGHTRNVPDDVLQRVKDNDGIVMVTYVGSFVSEELRRHYSKENGFQAKLEALYVGQPDSVDQKMSEWREANPAPQTTLSQVADHIDHIRDIIGVDHIGIGGDYDGTSGFPVGLEDVSTYPNLFAELLRRGYSEGDLKKIAGLNVLRVMRDAEEVAVRLQKERGPSETQIEDVN
ncbi:MAG: dipeptidase [Balneolales bacterium]